MMPALPRRCIIGCKRLPHLHPSGGNEGLPGAYIRRTHIQATEAEALDVALNDLAGALHRHMSRHEL